jgi:protein SCO1/2
MQNKKYYLLIIAAILAIWGLLVLLNPTEGKKETKDPAFVFEDSTYLKFQLIDHNGKIFDSQSLAHRPTLVYFGFTFCPDICPTALNNIAKVIQVMTKYNIALNAVFITVDPQRDDAATLGQYLRFFDQGIIGLTGSSEQIMDVAKIFGAYYAKDQVKDEKDYMVNHSSFIYVLDRNGVLAKLFSFNDDPTKIIDFLRLNFRANR